MKTIRKILCIVLSLLMIFSVFSIGVSAADITAVTGQEDASKINVKYTVEQVDSTDDYTFVDDSVYKVSIYAKAAYGIQYFQVPIYYDNTKFEAAMDASEDILGEELYLYDGWASDNGESTVYYTEKATVFSDTSMYTSGGDVATSKSKARYIGLGSSNATTVEPQWEAHDASSETYAAWTDGLADGTGIAFLCLDNLGNSKNAYFNSYDGAVNTDWAFMGAMYFVRLPDYTAEDVIGAEFGAYVGGNGLEGLWDTSGNPSYFKSTYVEAEPGLNIVSNAVVEETVVSSIITDGKDGIRFEKNADGTYANEVSVRTKALIAANEIQSRLGNITDNDAVEDKILEAGFVYIADANGTLNTTTAQTVAKTKADGESVDSHIKKSVSYIQYDGTNYSFTCLVDEIAHANIATADFNAYAYIVLDIDGDGVADDDEWFFAAKGNDASPSELYTAHSAAAWEAYGWGTAPAL